MTGHRRRKGRPIKAVSGINNSHARYLERIALADTPIRRVSATADRLSSSMIRADDESADAAADRICAVMLDEIYRLDADTVAKATEAAYRARERS